MSIFHQNYRFISMMLLAVIAFIIPASQGTLIADPIEVDPPGGPWYQFRFTGVGVDATACSDPVCGASDTDISIFVGDSPWTITGPVSFTITDVGSSGDSFNVFDFGELVLSTPLVSTGVVGVNDPDIALGNPSFSSGSIELGAGSHSITIQPTSSPFGAGSAMFKSVGRRVLPEPATLSILLLGVLRLRRNRCA